ncbi:MAG TPA: dethiobiotin synthase [Burkholderiales bacterium]|nr:dethiobiotin synthase [Burkholderiales bacterium]
MTAHRSPFTAHGFFVTGTDTGVGKTLAACALLHAFSARGLRTAGMKPVAAGTTSGAAGWHNDDVARLAAASSVAAPHALVNVYCFEAAVAPHIAAREADARIELAPIKRAYEALARQADIVVVEGVGGFCVPLNDHEDTADLAALLQLRMVLVVGLRLGCLNHALLTAAAIEARGLRLAAWIANRIDPDMAHADDNIAALEHRLAAPCIARIPFQRAPCAQRIAALLQTDRLIGMT